MIPQNCRRQYVKKCLVHALKPGNLKKASVSVEVRPESKNPDLTTTVTAIEISTRSLLDKDGKWENSIDGARWIQMDWDIEVRGNYPDDEIFG